MSSALYAVINQEYLTVRQQNAVEGQIAAASMEEINYRVGGLLLAFWLQVAVCLLTTTLPTWPYMLHPHLNLLISPFFALACF